MGCAVSRRKPPTLATLADNAAAGRRVVASSGQLDGPFLAALQRLNLSQILHTDGDSASTWGDGVTTANADSDIRQTTQTGGKHDP